MDNRQAALKAKVKAVNKAHTEAKRLYGILQPIFASLVGEKIEKVDGSLTQKVLKLVPDLGADGRNVRVWRTRSNYSLAWSISVSENYNETTCLYYETTVYIGNMRDGVLTDVNYDAPESRTDYTVDEVVAKRAAVKVAEKVLSDAQGVLFPFTERDG